MWLEVGEPAVVDQALCKCVGVLTVPISECVWLGRKAGIVSISILSSSSFTMNMSTTDGDCFLIVRDTLALLCMVYAVYWLFFQIKKSRRGGLSGLLRRGGCGRWGSIVCKRRESR